jgi:hypothetical protein
MAVNAGTVAEVEFDSDQNSGHPINKCDFYLLALRMRTIFAAGLVPVEIRGPRGFAFRFLFLAIGIPSTISAPASGILSIR